MSAPTTGSRSTGDSRRVPENHESATLCRPRKELVNAPARGVGTLGYNGVDRRGEPWRLFVSYSHCDEKLREKLDKHLSSLRRQGLVALWNDRRIGAGESFDREISLRLATADIVLLLVSADFLASEYCWGTEMSEALARHERGETIVIPVILRPCDWKNTPLGHLVALPTDGRPVASSSWANADSALQNIVEGIRKIVTADSRTRTEKAS